MNPTTREKIVLAVALGVGAVIFLSPPDKPTTPQAAGTRVGLTWDIDGDQSLGENERQLFKLAAKRVLADNPACNEISSGAKSVNAKSSDQYFLTCTASDGFLYNVFFGRQALDSSAPIRPPSPYDETRSRDMCRAKIMATAAHPSTVDLHRITGYGTKTYPNGARDVRQDFSAKNSYNLELNYIALCTVFPDGKMDYSVREKGGN